MSGAPRGVTARKLIGALHSDGFLLARTRSSHHIYWRADGRRVVVAIGTLKAMIEDV